MDRLQTVSTHQLTIGLYLVANIFNEDEYTANRTPSDRRESLLKVRAIEKKIVSSASRKAAFVFRKGKHSKHCIADLRLSKQVPCVNKQRCG